MFGFTAASPEVFINMRLIEPQKKNSGLNIEIARASQGAGEQPTDSKESKNLTAKQLQAQLKKAAKTAEQEAVKEKKKEEAARKKQARSTTRKTVALANKFSVPMTQSFNVGHEQYLLAEKAGLAQEAPVKDLKDHLEILGSWKKQAAGALGYFAKETGPCELAELPFDGDTAGQRIKDVAGIGQRCKEDAC